MRTSIPWTTALLMLGCGDSATQETDGATGGMCVPGYADCACTEDGLCLNGLACVDQVCVDAGAVPTTSASGSASVGVTTGTGGSLSDSDSAATGHSSTTAAASESATGTTQTTTGAVSVSSSGDTTTNGMSVGDTTVGDTTVGDTTVGDTTTGDTTTGDDTTGGDTTGPAAVVCGDGAAEGDEACDGADVKSASCVGLGFKGGKLGCTAGCALDKTGCTNNVACGDGIIIPGTLCYGPDTKFDSKLHTDVLVAEVTGDAHLDVITLSKEVRVWPGDGAGKFGAQIVSVTKAIRGQVVDLDKDGELDIVAVDGNEPKIRVLSGDGAGSFTLTDSYDTFLNAWMPTIGDANGDDMLDLVVTHYGDLKRLDVRLGKPGGKLGPQIAYIPPEYGFWAGFTDIDLDGAPDLWAGGFQGNFLVFPGKGDGTFELAPELTKLGGLMAFTAVEHLDDDPYFDVVTVLQADPGNMRVRLGDAMGFAPMTYSYPASANGSLNGVVLDVDGDDVLDVVAPLESGSGYVDVFRGDGTGLFYDGAPVQTAKYPRDIAAGDLNEDGLPDFAIITAIDAATMGMHVVLSKP